jgi:hypothetical protein
MFGNNFADAFAVFHLFGSWVFFHVVIGTGSPPQDHPREWRWWAMANLAVGIGLVMRIAYLVNGGDLCPSPTKSMTF